MRGALLDLVDGEVVDFLATQPKEADVEFLMDAFLQRIQPTQVALQRALMEVCQAPKESIPKFAVKYDKLAYETSLSTLRLQDLFVEGLHG